MKSIALGNELHTIVSDEDVLHVSMLYGCYYNRTTGYVHCKAFGNSDRRYLHQIIASRMGLLIVETVDHKDRNRLNNQRNNLRAATRAEQRANTVRISIEPYRGIQLVESGRYRAAIGINGRLQYIGTYGTAEEAAQAYNDFAIVKYGQFAILNEIKE